METEQELTPQEYQTLLAQYESSFKNLQEGQIIRGRVLSITPSEVIVDIGYKSEGMIPLDEFLDETGQVTGPGRAIVDVLLERTEDPNGYVVLSQRKGREDEGLGRGREGLPPSATVVIGRVIERIKGGLAVDIGVTAFLPGSQIDVRPVRNLDALRGQELRMQGHQGQQEARQHRALAQGASLEARRTPRRRSTRSSTLDEGKVLKGVVKNITEYGAFIDLGGIDGLLHITDMSWGRVDHPSELFKVGDEIDVIVLKFDPATERVSLGHKQLIADPWANVPENATRSARA